MSKKKNPKDLEGPFEAMKQLKADFPSVADDFTFKTCYSRIRKHVKKLKKIYEVETKAKQHKDLTDDQRDMLKNKRENEVAYEELLVICKSFIEAFHLQFRPKKPVPYYAFLVFCLNQKIQKTY